MREIGRGAMATVYEAVHRDLGKRVAIKVLSDAMRSAPNGTARFFREARIVGQLHHPHIVDAIDIGAVEGRPYLVMELLEGEDLEAYLGRKGALRPTDAVDLLLPVTSAVSAAHESGVIHRDLKPSNILVARRGGRVHPVVVDFGVSKRDDEVAASLLTHPETLVGTIAYMAPEQVRGARHASRMSDQYAVGVILYRCLTGRLPFAGVGEYEMMASIINAPLVPPSDLNPDVSPALDAIVIRAMSRQASNRFPSMLALGSALLDVASADALMLWSSELASDEQAQASPRAARQTRQDVVSMPTQVTHVTEVLTTQRWRPGNYGRPALALTVIALIAIVAFVSRGRQLAATAEGTGESTVKVAVHKDGVVTMDTFGDGEPNASHGAADRGGTRAGALPGAPAPAKTRLLRDGRRALPAANAVMGANEAPILE